MTQDRFADEPNLIQPEGPNYRLWTAIAGTALIIAVFSSIPLYNKWLEHKSHEAVRGDYEGAVYEIALADKPHSMELGWAGNRLAIALDPAPPPNAIAHLKGRFGEETLSWNDEYAFFGPSETPLNPTSHYKVSIKIETNGETLWSGKRWALGVHHHSHHH